MTNSLTYDAKVMMRRVPVVSLFVLVAKLCLSHYRFFLRGKCIGGVRNYVTEMMTLPRVLGNQSHPEEGSVWMWRPLERRLIDVVRR